MMMELDWLKRWNLYSPQKIAIKDGETGQEYSYSKLYEMANRGALVLSEKFNIKKGDRVAILATNELEYVFLFFAMQRLGAILVPVNFRLTSREIAHIVGDSQPQLLLYQEAFSSVVDSLPEQGYKKALFQGSSSFVQFMNEVTYKEVPFAPSEEDAVMILYTSGTTGSPKGAIISHRMIFWNSINTGLRLNLSQNDCTVIFLPFFHTGGWNVLTTPFIHRGAKVVFLKKFDADPILDLSAKEQATILFGVPTTMEIMSRSPLFNDLDLSKIRYAIVGGEPMPLELIKVWHKKGIPIRQGYGLTEFGPGVFSLNEEDALRKIGSIGFPNFYCDAKIVDNDGQELGADDIGELVLRGPICMSGYWRNEKATQDTIKDGWLHTGDLAQRDSEGYYYIVGRKKDMFISGGENVYPTELEQVIRSYPGVIEVAVVGVPDEKWGEVGKAFVVSESSKTTSEDLHQHCLQNLAKFKIPKYFVFMDALPKGDSGKILKRKLLEA